MLVVFSLRALLLLALVVGPSSTWVSVAQAQAQAEAAARTTTEAAARTQARERFLRGLDLAKTGRWDEALAEFTASVDLFRTGAALQNRAVSLVHLRRYAEARETYEALLQEFGDRLGADARKGVEQELSQLERVLGELVIVTEPPAVQVVIDGQQVGTTPLARPLRVNAGTHSLRLFRTEYEALERTITVAAGERKLLRERLAPLRRLGTLVVREATGRVLEVVIDGAIVGTTPWQGELSPGHHNATLRGLGALGSAPASVQIRPDETVTLVLNAVALDGALSVIPSPPDSRVFIDGVSVGNGIWRGRLPSGPHRIEVAARGHFPDRREVTLAPGEPERMEVVLERDLSNPLWKTGFSPYVYVEALGALAWAPSLGGDAQLSCDDRVQDLDGAAQKGCADESTPLGVLTGAHVGYQLTERLGLEVFLHYLGLSAEQRRRLRATMDDGGEAYSNSVKDRTSLRGPALGIAASYRVPSLPITARVWTGLLRAHVETHHAGTYVGRLENGHEFSRFARFSEAPQDVWIPFIGPELGVGKGIGRHVEVSLGVAALLFLPGDTPRTGAGGPLSTATGRRRKPFDPQEEPVPGSAEGVNLGNLELPREEALGTFWSIFPNARVRVSF